MSKVVLHCLYHLLRPIFEVVYFAPECFQPSWSVVLVLDVILVFSVLGRIHGRGRWRCGRWNRACGAGRILRMLKNRNILIRVKTNRL